jgi:hypothetical protein
MESYARRGASPSSLATVAETVGWDPLTEEQGQAKAQALAETRDQYRLLLEALIWARMYDFREAPPSQTSNPVLFTNQDAFLGISKRLQEYWRGRFQEAADQRELSQQRQVVKGDTNQSLRLRRYFAEIAFQVEQQARGGGDLLSALLPK